MVLYFNQVKKEKMTEEKENTPDHAHAYHIQDMVVHKYGQQTLCPMTPRIPYEDGQFKKVPKLIEWPCRITCPKANVVELPEGAIYDKSPAGTYLEISCNGTIQYHPLGTAVEPKKDNNKLKLVDK